MLIQRNLAHGLCSVVHQDCELLGITFLEELLAQIVAEGI